MIAVRGLPGYPAQLEALVAALRARFATASWEGEPAALGGESVTLRLSAGPRSVRIGVAAELVALASVEDLAAELARYAEVALRPRRRRSRRPGAVRRQAP